MILATNMLTIWEYEDFLLENYKQRLIESIKLNHLSTDNDNLNSTLQNVVIETNDSIDGLIRYRSMIKGVKGRKFFNRSISLNKIMQKFLIKYC
ncbi:unnamed protein product [Brugia pahangi]|uniref:Uncharacterized protein n=1 Tax=Brugia pahangi TaxID=6280 RepID=A0A0N4TUU7_BRUPA|nr:unnamed protein product [Brugia pahangi]